MKFKYVFLYANGLFQMAKGDKVEAQKFFKKAVNENPHLWAKFWLNTPLDASMLENLQREELIPSIVGG